MDQVCLFGDTLLHHRLVNFTKIGKSTVLRLISRIYDPVEGEILIDGRNIRSLKVADLRRAISVLFQDYTHFPLSVSVSRRKLS